MSTACDLTGSHVLTRRQPMRQVLEFMYYQNNKIHVLVAALVVISFMKLMLGIASTILSNLSNKEVDKKQAYFDLALLLGSLVLNVLVPSREYLESVLFK
jgi:hypothetical protein